LKLKQIYELAINLGKQADPRGSKGLKALLSKVRKEHSQLSKTDKDFFDTERLTNPYSDTRILSGKPNQEIKSILAGIDIGTSEILLADRLQQKNKKIDLVLSHHPGGKALASLDQVMEMQADIWHQFGVPINVGDMLIDKRAKEVHRAISPTNHNRAVDAAKLLGFAFMCVHTPCDNLVSQFLNREFAKKKPYRVSDVIELLRSIPEYKEAAKNNAGPNLITGNLERRAGQVMVVMTGGTGGPEDSIDKLAQAGVGTIVEMHMRENLREKAEKNGINVVIAGHMASDSIGMNLFLDKLEEQKINVISCAGLIRVKR
jgi:putative NIF3 family GTP cyclohydrolase 1 type 2